ncbi:MAG TPA: hypothetical protein VMC62_05815 [Longilinea sp.]|nr:hypothetical protein [Longilinea sp.]
MSTNPIETTKPEPVGKARTSIFSVLSLASGILTYLWFPFHSLIHMRWFVSLLLMPITAIIAIDLGHRGHHEIMMGNGAVGGQKLSTWGQILGYLYFGLIILLIALLVIMFKNISSAISTWATSMGGI